MILMVFMMCNSFMPHDQFQAFQNHEISLNQTKVIIDTCHSYTENAPKVLRRLIVHMLYEMANCTLPEEGSSLILMRSPPFRSLCEPKAGDRILMNMMAIQYITERLSVNFALVTASTFKTYHTKRDSQMGLQKRPSSTGPVHAKVSNHKRAEGIHNLNVDV
jgi:hypothetical protein